MGAQAEAEKALMDAAAGDLFRRAWWAVALRGLLAIVLGIVMLTWPGLTLAVFISMLGIYLFFDGLLALVTAFHAGGQGRSWWPYVLQGLVSIGVGLLAFARPQAVAFAVLALIAVRAIVVGVVEIATSASARRSLGRSPVLLGLAGLASIAFGVLLFARPVGGLLVLMWMGGIYALVFGVLLDGEAFRLRGAGRRLQSRAAEG